MGKLVPMRSYPLFVPPESIAEKAPRDFSRHEADLYFRWLLDSIPNRIDAFLEYIGEHASKDCVDASEWTGLLTRAGRKVVDLLQARRFSTADETGGHELTNEGFALVADMGFLVAQALTCAGGDAVRWEVLRKPKRDLNYNEPVLRGFGSSSINPIGGSVAVAYAILAGKGSSDEWALSCERLLGQIQR